MLHQGEADGIHRVEDAYVNWYIVEDAGSLTVVDTGHPASWRSLHEALRTLGRSIADIEAVVLTHGHFDHMGFAKRARRELGVPLWAHERELPVIRHPWRYAHEKSRVRYARHPTFLKVFTAMGAEGALLVTGTDDVQTFGSAGTLDVPGRPQIVFTPGHTYGHCALHFPDRGTVIAGDAIVMLNPYTGQPGPRIVAGAATADSALNLSSLEALAATGAETVLTGHGPAWRQGVGQAVAEARAAGPS